MISRLVAIGALVLAAGVALLALLIPVLVAAIGDHAARIASSAP